MSVSDWASFAVAAATGVLALFTWRLARSTAKETTITADALAASNRIAAATEQQLAAVQKQARASDRQAELTAEALRNASQPVMSSVPQRQGEPGLQVLFENARGWENIYESVVLVQEDEQATYLSVPLRNIGAGTALITALNVSSGPGLSWPGQMTAGIVPVGEVTRLSFVIPKDRPELAPIAESIMQTGNISVWVHYLDASGTQRFRARADVHRGPPGWRVRQVFLYRGDETEPYAASGPAD